MFYLNLKQNSKTSFDLTCSGVNILLTISISPKFVKIKVSVPSGSAKLTDDCISQALDGFCPNFSGTISSALKPKEIF